MSGTPLDSQTLKRNAATAALEHLHNGMNLGLGSGSTAEIFVELLGGRVRDGLELRCCATSERTARLARTQGIEVLPLEEFSGLDICIDGADEIDPQLNLIKGGGACHLREKVIASFSRQLLVIADESKLVTQLGAFRIPLEIIPFALPLVRREVSGLPGNRGFELRLNQRGQVMSDEGNLVADADFGLLDNPALLASELLLIPGLVEHGLFIDMARQAIVGTQDGVRLISLTP
jgi:ribose 5-phosphate isomerase A